LPKSAIRKRLEYGLFRSVSSRIRAADDARIARWGATIGALAPKLLQKRHALAIRNIALTFPEKSAAECDAIARAAWRHFGTMFLAAIHAHRESAADLFRKTPIERLHFDEAASPGKGIILVSAHFGTWEIGSNLLKLSEMKVTTVARFFDNELLDEELLRGRRRAGIDVVDRRDAARALVYALIRKEMVVLLADQHVVPHEGIRVPFLGRLAWTTTAPARLALRFGSPILMAFAYDDRVDLCPPIIAASLPEEHRNVEWITTRINDIISERIRRNPELWFWMHDRWKGRGTRDKGRGTRDEERGG
jgi:KDO2-lipid IV(A) lauroyltransferase